MARAVSTLHASGSFSHGLFFCVDSVVEISGPVFLEINWGSLVSDFIFLSVFLPVLSADNLVLLKLWSCREDSVFDIFIKLSKAETMEGSDDEFGKHLNCK